MCARLSPNLEDSQGLCVRERAWMEVPFKERRLLNIAIDNKNEG